MTDPHRFLQMACCRRSFTCAQELHGCDRTKVPFRQLCPREVSQLIRVLQVLRQMLEAGTGKAIIYQHVLFLWVFPCVSTMGDPQVTMGLTPSILHDLGYPISLFGTPPDNHSMNIIGRFTPRQKNIDEKNK